MSTSTTRGSGPGGRLSSEADDGVLPGEAASERGDEEVDEELADADPEWEHLASIAAAEHALCLALLSYASYCQTTRQPERALPLYRRIVHAVGDGPRRARVLLELGQLSEQRRDYASAAVIYAEGVGVATPDPRVAYFHRNNLGYSLNQLGRHAEAEVPCREAIALDASRANGHKNLGLALEGQGRHAEAVEAYLKAVEVCPADRRALDHMESLLARDPAVASEVPRAAERLARAREAVAEAARRRPN